MLGLAGFSCAASTTAFLNELWGRENLSQFMGDLNNHTSVTSMGMMAVVVPKYAEAILHSANVSETNRQLVVRGSMATLFALALAVELLGVGNTPDLLDTPFIALGLLGMASIYDFASAQAFA